MKKDDFKVGDSVICVDATDYLVQGKIYTVKDVLDDGTGLVVNECVAPKGYTCYKSRRFTHLSFTFKYDDLRSIVAGALNWFAYTNDIDKHEATKEFIKEFKLNINS